MKLIRVLLLAIALPVVAAAQEPDMDSLLAGLPRLTGQARIDCLSQLSQEFLWVNIDSARLFAEQALHESEQVHYQKGLDLSWYLTGSVQMLSGHNNKAEPRLRKALQLLKRYGLYYHGWCLLHLGFALYNQGQFREAIEHMEHSVPIMAKNDRGDGLAKAYTLLSLAYGAVGNYEKGFSNAALGYAERIRNGNTVGMGYSLRMLGRNYYLVNDYKTAIYYFKRCLALNRRSFSPLTECGEMAVILRRPGAV